MYKEDESLAGITKHEHNVETLLQKLQDEYAVVKPVVDSDSEPDLYANEEEDDDNADDLLPDELKQMTVVELKAKECVFQDLTNDVTSFLDESSQVPDFEDTEKAEMQEI